MNLSSRIATLILSIATIAWTVVIDWLHCGTVNFTFAMLAIQALTVLLSFYNLAISIHRLLRDRHSI